MARVFIISNRVATPDSDLHPGGLEVALKATLKNHPCVWMGWSGEIKRHPRTRTIRRNDNSFIVSDLTQEDFDEYYNGFANSVLWPVLHYRINLAEFSGRDLTGYIRVNEHFAQEMARILKPDDIVWVHDYHLIPLARALRARGFANRIGFFLHIPLPPPEIVAAMPHHENLFPSLCHYDLVGFQTEGDAANFARYLASELGTPTHLSRRLGSGDRVMRIGAFPVGIETRQFTRLARRAVKTRLVREVRKSIPGELIIGVDRLDYSKGITQRLEAYERFLAAHPEWHGKVNYLQITPRSRSQIKEYSEMEQLVNQTAGRINGAYSQVTWAPVRYVNRPYSRTALAGLYRTARAALVTPLRDGMNLVAKEYVAAQDAADPGVLILSRFAGAAVEFHAGALVVNPYDPESVGAAIAQAMVMPKEERRRRHATLYAALLKNDIGDWGDRFLSTLMGRESFALENGDLPLPAPAVSGALAVTPQMLLPPKPPSRR